MAAFETFIGLLLASVILAAAARRVGAPYPAFLALGGVVLAFVPGVPTIVLEPDLALALFVAPVLLDAAFDSSPRDLRDNWAPLLGLVVVAVAVTTAAVAWVAHMLVPAMPWAAAIALGAIVAPPDAAAATAVLKQVRPPHRILTILEGESLLNDATALLIYRLAVGAAVANTFAIRNVAPAFVLAVVGSVIVGPLLALLYMRLTRNLKDVPSAIVLQFIGTFGVWILAEQMRLSGVLTMVAFAITAARRAPEFVPARLRVPSYAVWETVVFVLNVLAFVLIGLQIRPILEGLAPDVRNQYLYIAGAVLLTVIIVRIVWVMTYNTVVRWKVRRYGFQPPRPMLEPSLQGGLIISWCGMRGVVSLAAALALPEDFPFRGLIVLTAFCVVLGTLIVQGLTLKPLLRAVDLHDDDPVGREVELARRSGLRAALLSLERESSEVADVVREEWVHLLGTDSDQSDNAHGTPAHAEAFERALAAARQRLLEMRRTDEIGDAAFQRLEEELDWIEMSGARR